jgi:hypothetical protein
VVLHHDLGRLDDARRHRLADEERITATLRRVEP